MLGSRFTQRMEMLSITKSTFEELRVRINRVSVATAENVTVPTLAARLSRVTTPGQGYTAGPAHAVHLRKT